MFESLVAPELDPEWVEDEPVPGDAAYQAYLAWEGHQFAFWAAYAESVGSAGDVLPDLAGLRTEVGLLDAVGRVARAEAQVAGAKLRSIADYALRRMRTPEIGYDERCASSPDHHRTRAKNHQTSPRPPTPPRRYRHSDITSGTGGCDAVGRRNGPQPRPAGVRDWPAPS